jgi:hypothetical protein
MLRLAFVISFNVALASADTPVEKVVKMLTDLRTQVNEEGAAEAETYNTFACFCKTTMAAKSEAITEGKQEKETLEARINEDTVSRDEKDTEIQKQLDEIKTVSGEIAQAKEDRNAEFLTYSKNEVDLTAAIRALDSAITSLKAAKTAVGFTQLSPTVQRGLIMAQALMPEGKASKTVAAFISSEPNEAYSFQSDEVITTLEGLKTDFRTKKNELDEADVTAKQTFTELLQTKEQAIKDAETNLETAKKDKATLTSQVATASTDLSSVSATLLDDQVYQEGLSKTCNEKAVLWDKRTTSRASELTALTSAINLIEGLPEETSGEEKTTFVQVAQTQRSPRKLQTATHAAPATAHKQQTPAPAKKQLSAAAVKTLVGKRGRVLDMLRQKAKTLKSAELENLVRSAKDDPLAKVKTMIQALIERLLTEAANEASHKGYCDKEYALITLKRDNAAQELKELNGLLELSEARRAKLAAEEKDLQSGLEEIEKAVTKATELREKEKEENAKAKKDAEDGVNTVAEAIDILEKHYKTAANEASDDSFLQLRKSKDDPEAPDAGFDGEYAGAQDGAVGVLGMLEVVKSDFERTVKEAEKDEQESEDAFKTMEAATGASKAAKTEALTNTQSAKSDADSEDTRNRESLTSNQALLDAALNEWAALDKTCQDKGMTAEERKQQREEEIDALKQALEILDSH